MTNDVRDERIWPMMWGMRRHNKSVATKIQYEDPLQGN